MAAFRKGNQVELMISCQDLVDLDIFTKSDPMCVLFVKQFGQWKEFGRTESIRNTLNPSFTTSFVLDFEPGLNQPLLFSVYDIDSGSTDLKHHDFVGSVEVKLDAIVDETKTVTTSTRTLRTAGDPKSRGIIIICAEMVRPTRSKVFVHAAGHKLDRMGMLKKKPDTYLEIGRQINSITYQAVFRTEVFPKTRNPWWRPFEVSVQKICNDDWERPIRLSCWHTSHGGGPKATYSIIGQITLTLRQLQNLEKEHHYKRLELVSPKKEKQNKKHVLSGSLRLYQFRIEMQYSLLDYIRGGCQLRLIVAVDFTSSNGAISDVLSLHNTDQLRENQYLNAIESLGGMIARYDLEQKIAAFGFGARRSSTEQPCHCFPLSDDPSSIWMNGVKSVMEAYHRILPSLIFSGPTYVSPVLDTVTGIVRKAKQMEDEQIYYVLLIVTDGVINDIDATIERLVSASGLPLSVIFLGVGPTDFSLMEQFHTTENVPLFDGNNRRAAQRANTYFTALKKDSLSSGGSTKVVQETLACLSTQVLQYMKDRGHDPGKPRVMRADPRKSWIDPTSKLDDDEEEEINGTFNMPSSKPLRPARSRTSLISRKSFIVSDTGPVCPTCGSPIMSDFQTTNEMIGTS